MSPTFVQAWHVHTDGPSPMKKPSVVSDSGAVVVDEGGSAINTGGIRCSCGVRLFAGAGPTYTHEHQSGTGQLAPTGEKRRQGSVELEDWTCSCGETFAIATA
jgi:hypothetical protein